MLLCHYYLTVKHITRKKTRISSLGVIVNILFQYKYVVIVSSFLFMYVLRLNLYYFLITQYTILLSFQLDISHDLFHWPYNL